MSYGRNFEVISDQTIRRPGRFVTPSANEIPIGAPIGVDVSEDPDGLGLQPIELVSGDVSPVVGMHGILIYEHVVITGDPVTTTPTDLTTAPVDAAVQMIGGAGVELRYENSDERTFYNRRTYAAIEWVAGDLTTIVKGDILRPHDSPSAANGYWQVLGGPDTSTGWAVVTRVVADTADFGHVQVQLLF